MVFFFVMVPGAVVKEGEEGGEEDERGEEEGDEAGEEQGEESGEEGGGEGVAPLLLLLLQHTGTTLATH